MNTCLVEANCKVIHFSINNKMFRRKYQYIIVCPVRSERLARTSSWGSQPWFPGGLHGRSVWRMENLWFPFNNINSKMAMEAFVKEFHDSVQALSPEKSAQRHREVVCQLQGRTR